MHIILWGGGLVCKAIAQTHLLCSLTVVGLKDLQQRSFLH